MRKRIGTKIYDTDTAILVDTLDDGSQVYRKTGRSQDVFIYNPNKHEMFFDVPEDEAQKYLTEIKTGKNVFGSNSTIRFSSDNRNRIKRFADSQNMSMASFILMLVDRYEKDQQ